MSVSLQELTDRWTGGIDVEGQPLRSDLCHRATIIWKQKHYRTELILYRRSGWANNRTVPRVQKRFSAVHRIHGSAPFLVLAERALEWLDENPDILRRVAPHRRSIRDGGTGVGLVGIEDVVIADAVPTRNLFATLGDAAGRAQAAIPNITTWVGGGL